MLNEREDFQEALCHCTTDTLAYHQVIKFCEEFPKWKHAREEEIETILDIKDKDDKINKNFFEVMKDKLNQKTADSQCAELQKELAEGLMKTRGGLEKLSCFLDAVEKLAVTSPDAVSENQLLHLSKEIRPEDAQIVNAAACLLLPLLLELKGDAKTLDVLACFEVPKLKNIKEMKTQLDRYILTSEKFFECLGKSFISQSGLKMKIAADQNRLQHMLINQTEKIRKKTLCYATDTLTSVEKVIEFCEGFSEWKDETEEKIKTMADIKDRADKLNMTFGHVKQSKEQGKAFLEFMKSKLPKMTEDSRYAELEKELEKVITKTLESLENLSCFLDAVARLAVTSLHVFTENQLLHLPEEINLEYVHIFIAAARLFCPLLLVFKTEAKIFFLPKLQNVDVLACQLDRYIQTAETFFERLGESFIRKSDLKMNILNDQKMFQHLPDQIHQLDEIRMDPNLRMVFLFGEVCCSQFIDEFNKRKSGMLEFLNELEGCAVQLENMNKGALISSVAGSSVGAVGGVLSIVGLALAPVTAGVSLALTMTGVGLGITSAVNGVVTSGTEVGVNTTQKNRANEILQKLMEDVQSFQNCLQDMTGQTVSGVKVSKSDVAIGAGKIALNMSSFGKGIDSIVDAASAVKMLQSDGQIITSAGRVLAQEGKSLRNVPRVASDIPEMGIGTAQAAVKAPLALSKTMRGLFIFGNAFFIGMDLFFICKDSFSLAKGNKTEISQFIRARAELLRSEFDSWQKIHDSLDQGLKTLERKKRMDPGYAGQRSSSPEKNKSDQNEK